MNKDLEHLIRGLFAGYRLVKKLRKSHAKRTKHDGQRYWEPVPPLTLRVPMDSERKKA